MGETLLGIYVFGAVTTLFISALLMLFISPREDIKELVNARRSAARAIVLLPVWPILVAWCLFRAVRHTYRTAAFRGGGRG